MGRRKEIDTDVLLDLTERGFTNEAIAEHLDCTPQTVSKRIADLQSKQGVLLQYRSIQSLQLTELQARCLEAITPEKLADATLHDLVSCFKILKDAERVIEGKPTDLKGLVGYLLAIDKEELEMRSPSTAAQLTNETITEVVGNESSKDVFDAEYIPKL